MTVATYRGVQYVVKQDKVPASVKLQYRGVKYAR